MPPDSVGAQRRRQHRPPSASSGTVDISAIAQASTPASGTGRESTARPGASGAGPQLGREPYTVDGTSIRCMRPRASAAFMEVIASRETSSSKTQTSCSTTDQPSAGVANQNGASSVASRPYRSSFVSGRDKSAISPTSC
ncbi:hypothetical protein [Gordonia namibiensis]|uniref:hypothetical protein n=1 Tax=Gordonia namibiensis TaxID=168480 RepID=UPI001FDF1DD3|nr:hypothetical protein [Gordonia namibiensis]